jgi:FkbM family methyltransferase
MLGLARWIGDDIQSAVMLSFLTGPMIREAFPQGHSVTHTVRTRSGLDLDVDASDIFAASLALGSLQEADDFAAFMALVEPGATVVDVGANFGLYGLHAALYAGATGQVFAFEPVPGAYDLLAANIRRNGLERICMAARSAVADANRTAQFRVAAESSFTGLRDTGRSRTAEMIDVEVIALDAFAPLARRSVDLMKIDVEGGEAGVLAGARNLLGRSPDVVVMFEYSHKNLDGPAHQALLAELRRLGQMGFEIFTRPRTNTGLRRIRLDELTGTRSENLFMFRPQSRHGARLSSLKVERPRPNRKDRAMLRMLERTAGLFRRYEGLIHEIRVAAKDRLGADSPVEPAEAFLVLRRAWESGT